MNPAPATLLVIDDDPTNLQVALDELSAYDYAVLTARDGERGFRRAIHVRPDLILLDIGLPGADGHEVCRRLKTHPNTAHIPVIFMTARRGLDDKLRAFELDGVDFLTKPFAAAELLARVRAHLRFSRDRAALGQQRDRLQTELEHARAELAVERQGRRQADVAVREKDDLLMLQSRQLAQQAERWLDARERPGFGREARTRIDTEARMRLGAEVLERAASHLPTGHPARPLVDEAVRLLTPALPADGVSLAPGPVEANPLERLSQRELEVFDHLVRGTPNKEISAALGVGASTVSTYRMRILDKLEAEGVPDLVRIGLLHRR